ITLWFTCKVPSDHVVFDHIEGVDDLRTSQNSLLILLKHPQHKGITCEYLKAIQSLQFPGNLLIGDLFRSKEIIVQGCEFTYDTKLPLKAPRVAKFFLGAVPKSGIHVRLIAKDS